MDKSNFKDITAFIDENQGTLIVAGLFASLLVKNVRLKKENAQLMGFLMEATSQLGREAGEKNIFDQYFGVAAESVGKHARR